MSSLLPAASLAYTVSAFVSMGGGNMTNVWSALRHGIARKVPKLRHLATRWRDLATSEREKEDFANFSPLMTPCYGGTVTNAGIRISTDYINSGLW